MAHRYWFSIPYALTQKLKASEFLSAEDCVRHALQTSPTHLSCLEEVTELMREGGPRHPMDSMKEHLKNMLGETEP